MTLPPSFLDEMKALLGDEYEDYLAAMNEEPYQGLRVNTSKISVCDWEIMIPFPGERVPWTRNGFITDADARPALHPYHAAGLYYEQEPAAMLPAELADPQPGEWVLDLCAAPGGKSTELGARLKGTGGLLVANDISASRSKALLKNMERFGITESFITCEEPKRLADVTGPEFDKVLVDAPCSGEGMFRKDPSLIRHFASHGPEYYAPIQKDILTQAVRMLKPGGRLIYSTCTFSVAEDEDVVNWLLSQDDSLSLVPIPLFEGASPGVNGEGVIRLYPHKVKGEGHFAAVIKKEGPIDEEKRPHAFADKSVRERIWQNGDQVLLLPRGADGVWKCLRYLRTGLLLGEMKNDRFTPSQAAAMAAENENIPRFSLPVTDERVTRYLKGETILLRADELMEDGRILFQTDSFPLGWLKVNDRKCKNLYPAGWIMR